jgi:hypothetical protein
VLITGGFSGDYSDDSAAIFDPATGQWNAVASLRSHSDTGHGRANHTATLLPNGKILIAGGASGYCCDIGLETLDAAELFDPGLSGSAVPARKR